MLSLDDEGRMENTFSAKKSGYGRSFVTLSMRSGVILLVGFVMVLLLVGIVAAGAAGCSSACGGVGGCSVVSALFSSSVDSFKYVEYAGII